jgi:hypothetical protein
MVYGDTIDITPGAATRGVKIAAPVMDDRAVIVVPSSGQLQEKKDGSTRRLLGSLVSSRRQLQQQSSNPSSDSLYLSIMSESWSTFDLSVDYAVCAEACRNTTVCTFKNINALASNEGACIGDVDAAPAAQLAAQPTPVQMQSVSVDPNEAGKSSTTNNSESSLYTNTIVIVALACSVVFLIALLVCSCCVYFRRKKPASRNVKSYSTNHHLDLDPPVESIDEEIPKPPPKPASLTRKSTPSVVAKKVARATEQDSPNADFLLQSPQFALFSPHQQSPIFSRDQGALAPSPLTFAQTPFRSNPGSPIIFTDLSSQFAQQMQQQLQQQHIQHLQQQLQQQQQQQQYLMPVTMPQVRTKRPMLLPTHAHSSAASNDLEDRSNTHSRRAHVRDARRDADAETVDLKFDREPREDDGSDLDLVF